MTVIPADLVKMPKLGLAISKLERMADMPLQVFQELHDALVDYLEEK